MPPVITASVPEMAAAEALLELCYNARRAQAEAPNRTTPSQLNSPAEQESSSTEALQSLSCLVGTAATSTPKNKAPCSPTIINLASGGYIVRHNTSPAPLKKMSPVKGKRLNLHKKHQDEQRRWIINKPAQHLDKIVREIKDAATQTDVDDNMAQIYLMESKIKELSNKIQNLEQQLDSVNVRKNDKSIEIEKTKKRTKYNTRSELNSDNYSNKVSSDSENNDRSNDKDFTINEEDDMTVSEEETSDEGVHNIMIHKSNETTIDMVPIGDGNAIVPRRLLRQLDWSSYTNATRKLLTAVFSRRVLATHSLTGKPSPAFPDKPAKKKLDAAIVNDIVQTVVDRCKVPENVVRTSITTKCADESKMLRSRQLNRKKNRSAKKENVPPRTFGLGGSRQP